MTRVAVTLPYFDFFPELKAELATAYPDTKFPDQRLLLEGDALVEYLQGCDAAVIGLNRFTDDVCSRCPELKVVSLCSAGVDHIDPAVLNRYGIRMWWAAGINKVSVAELAICYMVLTLRRIHQFASILRAGEWTGPIGFGGDLKGQTVGIHGAGHIGGEVIRLLQPYGVEILVSDREDKGDLCGLYPNVTQVDAQEMWARSDVVSIHLSRNSSTIGLYTAEVLDAMKPGAVLINCARGGMVDEVALAERMRTGRIAGAAFDVFAVEPANGNPLIDLPTFFASPHVGATTRDSWAAMLRSGMYGIEHAYRAEPGIYPFD